MNRTGLGLAVGAGYLLGRSRKLKLAIAVGTLAAGKKLNLTPRGVAELVAAQLRENPQFKEIGDQLRTDLRGVGSAASGALVERQIDALADRLHGRTAQLRDGLSGAAPEDDATDETDKTDETDETDETRDDGDADEAGDTDEAAGRGGAGEPEDAEDAEDAEDDGGGEEPEGADDSAAPGREHRRRPERREPRGGPGAGKNAPARKPAGSAPAKKATAKAPARRTVAKKARPAAKTAGERKAETGRAARSARSGPAKGGDER
ncbi:DNA primase [Streptomyces sp. AD55]|uniref:DNA primase n=1 Tax=Streptomyces sp. AD55 TaxID=3242895 RepID=UPI003527EFA0